MRAYEDFHEGLSIPIGPYRVSREEILAFATEFDPQPFHLDEEAAAASILGGLSASGWHSCAMLMRMMVDAFILESTSQGSPGVDHVKWSKPVRPGDTLTGTVTVRSNRPLQSRPHLGIAKLLATLDNDRGDRGLESEYA